MSRAPVAAAVRDYGGVLTTPVRHSIAAWVDRDGIDLAAFLDHQADPSDTRRSNQEQETP